MEKKWSKCWEEVKYCGQRCRLNKKNNLMEVTFIYPNQLFDPHPAVARNRTIFLIEDPLFFGDKKYFLITIKRKFYSTIYPCLISQGD